MSLKLYTLNDQFIDNTNNFPNNFTGIVRCHESEEWFLNGYHHREDGPAIIWLLNNDSSWWLNGERHRIGGPAFTNNSIYFEYYIHGKRVAKEYHDLLCDVMKLKGLK